MKGIVLAGGSGTRLFPATLAVSKQLLPVHDKPMIYYPISVLLLAGIREIMFITTPECTDTFKRLLGDGRDLGCDFQFGVQRKPNGIAQALIIAHDFIGNEKVALILGDNFFFGSGLGELVREHSNCEGAVIFASRVEDPKRYGVVEFDQVGNVSSIEEKPRIFLK